MDQPKRFADDKPPSYPRHYVLRFPMIACPEEMKTVRLLLRRIRGSDAEFVYTYASDPKVTRYVAWRTHTSLKETTEYLTQAELDWDTGKCFEYLLMLRNDGIPCGAVSLIPDRHSVTIGYVLSRSSWGKGFASEAANAIVNLALSWPNIYRVWTVCDVEHKASARVLQKLGMNCEGVLKKWKVRPNIDPDLPRDCFCFAVVRET